MSIDYKVETTISGDKIWQEVSAGSLFDGGIRDVIVRNVIDAKEQGIREALIAMGWTPPGEPSTPLFYRGGASAVENL